jgi:cell wall-associated NlpC family hydrolase
MMYFFKVSIKLLILLILISLLAACSSSSNSQRYNRNEDEDENKSRKSVRFTADDDETTYNNPSESREFDEEPYEEYPVDKEAFIRNYKNLGRFSSELEDKDKVLLEIVKLLDTPYQYGGESEDGIDCSAFTRQVFSNALKLNLPRTASQQYQIGNSVKKTNLKFGDLVFFNTQRGSYPGHVGIFVGDDMFAHASISQGVTISSLRNSYYQKRFVGAKRVE